MKESPIHFNFSFISDNQASKITEPCKCSFNLPAFPITSKFSTILGFRLFSITSMRRNQVYFQVLKSLSKRIAVIGFIGNKPFGRFLGRPRPARGSLTASSVSSASFTSAGDAEARVLPKGIPWPSTTTIHFVPLPFLVFPTQAPFFLLVQSCHQ